MCMCFMDSTVFWLKSYPLKHSTLFAFDFSYSFCSVRVLMISKNHLAKSIWILRDRIIIYESVAWHEYLRMSYKVWKIEVSSGNTESLLSRMAQSTLVMILWKSVSKMKRMRKKWGCVYVVSPTISNLAKHLVKPVSGCYKNYCFQYNFEKKKAWIINIAPDYMVEFNNMRLHFIYS